MGFKTLREQASPNGISAVPNIGQLLIRGRSPFAHLPDQILSRTTLFDAQDTFLRHGTDTSSCHMRHMAFPNV